MAMDTKLKSGVDYLPHYNWGYGMNDDLAYADRAGYNTSVEMVTAGSPQDWIDFSGLEVGPTMYEMDPMGEDRVLMTFYDDGTHSTHALHQIGMLTTEGAGQQEGTSPLVGDGKHVNVDTPQTYTAGHKMPTK